MASLPGTPPTDQSLTDGVVFRNAFLLGESLTFSVTGTAAATWEVRNYYGVIVASGTRSGSTITVPPLPLGWYKMYLIRASPAAAPWYTSGGEQCFCVVRATSPLLTRPDPSQATSVTNGEAGSDLPARGFFGVGAVRHKITTLADTSGITPASTEIAYETTWRATDSARPLKPLTAFPNGYDQTTTASTNLTSAVQACVAQGGVWFEGANEPNASLTYAAYAPQQNAFADVVHAASASAKVLGPGTVTVTGVVGNTGTGLGWLDAILPLVSAKLDGISFHNYSAPQGDLAGLRKVFDDFLAVLTKNGVQNKPRWNTEFGSAFAAAGGSFEPRFQAKSVMLDLHVHEQYGVPKEQTSLFYDRSHGFWSFPSMWLMQEFRAAQPTPLAPLMRVWAEELFGKNYSARLDFGAENNVWIGSRFTGSDGSSVVALQSSGHVGTVTVSVTGASSVVTVDPWGNLTTRTVTGGVVTVPVDELPSYVRCPTGVTVAPVAADWGVETVKSQATTFTASSNAGTAALAGDTVLNTSTGDWTAADGTLPATWQVTFPKTTRFNRVVVTCPAPHNLTCTLLDFDIQALVSGTWTTVATFTEATPQKVWTSSQEAGGCYVDSFWSRRNQWMARLATPVAATALRLYIRSCSYGGGATPETYNQNPNYGLGLEIGQAGPQLPTIREVQIYLNEYDQGKVAGTPVLVR